MGLEHLLGSTLTELSIEGLDEGLPLFGGQVVGEGELLSYNFARAAFAIRSFSSFDFPRIDAVISAMELTDIPLSIHVLF